jgi:hypothetical protein
MEPITINVPIFIEMGKRKKTNFSLNLNQYRNAPFHLLSDVKVKFQELVAPRIAHIPPLAKTNLTFRLYYANKRSVDVTNICSVVDKFFCDALVNCGKLPDDNMEIINTVKYTWGGVDAKDPRIEVEFTETEIQQQSEEDKPMQITFIQSEIEEALLKHLHDQITLRPDQVASMELKATRGDDGIVAHITISKNAVPEVIAAPAPTPAPAPVKRTTTLIKPKEEPKQAEEPKQGEQEVAPPQEAVQEATQEAVETPVVAPKTIFPSAASSAPVPQETTQVSTLPVTAPKSLFANLTPPVHDPKPGT